MSSPAEELMARIAGTVIVSQNPGNALKMWRGRLELKQIVLAKEMNVSPSVLSDYESGRRSSPGIGFIKRYIDALVKLDQLHRRLLQQLMEPKDKSAILAIGEFGKPVKAKEVVEIIQAEVLVGENLMNWTIYGYTLLDSIRAMYSLSGFDFYRIFGATTERAVIFTKVGTGRSPLVAIRVSQLKPRMVVLHGLKEVKDRLPIDLAERENIILALSSLPSESMFAQLLSSL